MTLLKQYQNGVIEYVKYCLIGTTCAIIDLGVLNGLLFYFPTDKTYVLILYNTAAYGLAVLNSYFWNSKYTFKVAKTANQFIAFITQAAVSLVIANFIFIFGLWILGTPHVFPGWLATNIAKALSMFLSSTASFFFNKFIVFRKQPVPFRKRQNDNENRG